MRIKIENWFTKETILKGKAENIKDFLEKNPWANLAYADLTRANLVWANLTRANLAYANLTHANLTGADLNHANLTHAYLAGADLTYADLTGANLTGANLIGANLTHANLAGADLAHADLFRANLTRANLTGIRNYSMSHDVAIQLLRNHLEKFTIRQQEIGSRIFNLRLCWPEIREQYGRYMKNMFQILADLGWNEYLKYWESMK